MLFIKKNIITVCIFGAVLLTGCAPKDKVLTFGMESEGTETTTDTIEEPARDQEENDDPGLLCVYVCGAVNSPGVVYLPEGSRVKDALELAGGFSEEADEIRVNLAQSVYDGQQIYFPRAGEEDLPVASGNETDGGETGLVNINTADKTLLCTVPGIGEVKAEAIVKYRTENGLFSDISGIVQVPGIGEGVYEKIKDYICTDSK